MQCWFANNNMFSLIFVKQVIMWVSVIHCFVHVFVTWSREMSRMSLIFILSYRLKQMTYSYVLHCFEIQRIALISWTRCRIARGYGSKCRICYAQVDYIENSKLNITDKWLISLDHVTFNLFHAVLVLQMTKSFNIQPMLLQLSSTTHMKS